MYNEFCSIRRTIVKFVCNECTVIIHTCSRGCGDLSLARTDLIQTIETGVGKHGINNGHYEQTGINWHGNTK